MHQERKPHPSPPGLGPVFAMSSALSGQDIRLNSIMVALDMLPPEGLLDRPVVLGADIKARKLRLNP